MANTFYANKDVASLSDMLRKLSQFLNNHLGGSTGPGASCIAAYSGNSMTPYARPTADDGNILDLPADSCWINSATAFANGDYIVMQFTDGAGHPWQIGFKFVNSTNLAYVVSPKAGWVLANGNADLMNAGNWSATPLNLILVNGAIGGGAAKLFVYAHLDFVYFWLSDGNQANLYTCIAGRLTDTNAGHPAESKVVQYIYPKSVNVGPAQGLNIAGAWYKISAVDNATIVACTCEPDIYLDVMSSGSDYAKDAHTGQWELIQLAVRCFTDGHYHRAGHLDGIFCSGKGLGQGPQAMVSLTHVYAGNSISYSPVISLSDGVTQIP